VAGSSGKLAFFCQVLRRQAMQCLVDQNSLLKFNVLSQDGCDVLSSRCWVRVPAENHRCGITHSYWPCIRLNGTLYYWHKVFEIT